MSNVTKTDIGYNQVHSPKFLIFLIELNTNCNLNKKFLDEKVITSYLSVFKTEKTYENLNLRHIVSGLKKTLFLFF